MTNKMTNSTLESHCRNPANQIYLYILCIMCVFIFSSYFTLQALPILLDPETPPSKWPCR